MRLHTEQSWHRYRDPSSVLLNKFTAELLPQQHEQFAIFVFVLWLFITVFFTSPFNASRSNLWGQNSKERADPTYLNLCMMKITWEEQVSHCFLSINGFLRQKKPCKSKHKHCTNTKIFRFVWIYPNTAQRISGLFRFGLCFVNSFHKTLQVVVSLNILN